MTPPAFLTRRNLLRAGVAVGAGAALASTATPAHAATHPGMLHTQADLDRMAAMVSANAHPWRAGWDLLVTNGHAQSSWTPRPAETIIRGGTGQNYPQLYNDVHAAYQNALRWKITGDSAHGDCARNILNAWSGTLQQITGNSDANLAAGIYGYQFANVAEIMRGYPGFDLGRFQQMMLTVFYPLNDDFLVRHQDACITNYWANWDLCVMASIMAIGILTDDQSKFDRVVDYFYNGAGNGSLPHAIPFVYGDDLAQWQESGRDQAHSIMGIGLLGTICEMAWNQGVDLYGADDNRFRKACEYVARYNLGYDVPFTTYTWGSGQNCAFNQHTVISDVARGQVRPVWERVYHHYAIRRGMAVPNMAAMVAQVRAEGGGGHYGTTSGGFDELGFGTLAYTRSGTTTTLPTGVTRSFQSVNYSTRYIRHQNWLGYLHEVTSASSTLTKQDATFTIVPGLTAAPSAYSLRAANGQYLLPNSSNRLILAADDGSATFRKDATFIARPGVVSGSVALECLGRPQRFIRHGNFELWVDPYQATSIFQQDSAFWPVAPWA